MNMNPVVHFEMPADDRKRMVDFYTKVFGWQATVMGPEMSNYVVVQTTKSDVKTGRPTTPGAINGGFYQATATSGHNPSVVIAVDDVAQAINKITQAGGKIVNGPDDIPGVGIYASFKDTEGNRVSILQPSPQM